jgi:hypothetical protein
MKTFNGGKQPKSSSAMRLCFKCNRERVPEGGVDVGPGKWKCVDCWRGVSPAKIKSGIK